MARPITSDVVVAYTHCPRKAFLLLCTDERGAPPEYTRLLSQQQQTHQTAYINALKEQHPDARLYSGQLTRGDRTPLLAVTLRTADLEASCAALLPLPHQSSTRSSRYEPAIAAGTHTLNEDHRLELRFVAHLLGLLQQPAPISGRIVGLGGRITRVPLAKNPYRLEPILQTLRSWTQHQAEPPPAILNRHCPECPFQAACASEAERVDDLSLLDKMTPQLRQRYHERGIFTTRQLSYVFKPRRRSKHRPQSSVQHKHELQALALRTGKTYLHDLPKLDRAEVELFLDMEGVPDRHQYYLMGVLVVAPGTVAYHGFWANTPEEEGVIWRQLMTKLAAYPTAPVYHYGSYESRAFLTLTKRYPPVPQGLAGRLVNINALVYGRVYFPVRSNRLKDIGRFLGASWASANASGLQSIVWRQQWEDTGNPTDKDQLLAYNEDDCRALLALTNELTRLQETAASATNVDFANRPKRHATDAGEALHAHLELILQSAHATYQQRRIALPQNVDRPHGEPGRPGAPKGHQGYGRVGPRAKTTVQVPPLERCPRCEGGCLQPTKTMAAKTVIDLRFSRNGCRKTITRYAGPYAACPHCGQRFLPPAISALGNYVFGHGFQAWVVYQRLVLRLPYRAIVQALEDLFGEDISEGAIINFVRHLASYYASTEDACRTKLLTSPFVHVDETKVSVEGIDQYVWVFTDGTHTIFRLTKTREAAIVREVLRGYSGVLVSDFYGGYDAVECRQQKCLVHLIRDLNDDLWREPFNGELEEFVLQVKNLLVPILDTAARYGLKTWHLGKFAKDVERFYRTFIDGREYKTQTVATYQKRFRRYRDSLFTFLYEDGIPWNNNMAERAIRHLAVQRKISGQFYETLAPQYLLLLGLAQTCRFQDKSFLQFLLSEERDVDAFRARKRVRSSVAVGHAKSGPLDNGKV